MYFTLCVCVDPFEDQFEKKRKVKDESVAKNEYQRLKNLSKEMKGGRVKGESKEWEKVIFK